MKGGACPPFMGGASFARLLVRQVLDAHTRGLQHLAEGIIELITVLLQGGPLVRRIQSLLAFLGCGDLAEIAYLGVKEQGLTLTAVFDDAAAGTMFLGLVVNPTSGLLHKETKQRRTVADRILVTAYDPAHPAREHYIPEGITPDDRFVWVFDSEEMIEEAARRAARGPGTGGGPET